MWKLSALFPTTLFSLVCAHTHSHNCRGCAIWKKRKREKNRRDKIKREKGQHILSTSKSQGLYHTSLSWRQETVGDVQWLGAKGPKIKDDIQLCQQLADHNNEIDNGQDAFWGACFDMESRITEAAGWIGESSASHLLQVPPRLFCCQVSAHCFAL